MRLRVFTIRNKRRKKYRSVPNKRLFRTRVEPVNATQEELKTSRTIKADHFEGA